MNEMEGYRQLDLHEIHDRILDVMTFLHEFCEKNHIRYYVAYGSLIGAIRHKGFIPWDDDFDIQMPREDYIRFQKLFKEQCGNNSRYKLCTRANTQNYYFGIGRFCDQSFRYVTSIKTIEKFEQGIFVDIYPLDRYGNTVKQAEKLKHKARAYNTNYTIYVNKKSSSSNKLVQICKVGLHYIMHMMYGEKYSERIDDKIYQYIKVHTTESDRYIGVVCWDQKVVTYDKSWFEKRILADFEDRKFWIPKEYDAVLRASYGDYMTLPPEEQRVMTHDYKIYEKIKDQS